MRVRQFHFNRDDMPPEFFELKAEQGFAAIDPDAAGAFVIYRPGERYRYNEHFIEPADAILDYPPEDAYALATQLDEYNVDVLVCEMGFITPTRSNARSEMQRAREMGIVIGMLAARRKRWINVVWLAASTWQNQVLKLSTPRAKRPERMAAVEAWGTEKLGSDDRYTSRPKARRLGIASARGIAEWWVRQTDNTPR